MAAQTYIAAGYTVEELVAYLQDLKATHLSLEHEIQTWSSGNTSVTRESIASRKRELEATIMDVRTALSILDPDTYPMPRNNSTRIATAEFQ